jgi:hypothetical protein
MARRDVCTRSAEAPAVAEDMLLRLAITLCSSRTVAGPSPQLMVGLCVCVRIDLECVRRAGLSDEENRQADQQTQLGNTSCVQRCSAAATRRTRAIRYPRNETQRGRAEVRSPTVLTDSVNTAAIRMA